MSSKKLYLIGAGPGDKELITLKAVKALGALDVVLYDALINPEILEYTRPNCEKIYVGKRCGKGMKQEEINQLTAEYLEHFFHVGRLKGGDPFVFGRGFEEMLYIQQQTEAEVIYIPGVSSFSAVSGSEKFPLTHRGVSDGFWVLPGVNKERQIPLDMEKAAQSNSTIVVLMPLMNLEHIIEVFLRFRRAETPACIVQNISLENQQSITGMLQNICQLKKEHEIQSPATLVIGDVIAYKNRIKQNESEYAISDIY